MAASQKLYPRATLKKIVKAHSKRNVTKNVDVLVRNATRLSMLTIADDPGRSFSTMLCSSKRMYCLSGTRILCYWGDGVEEEANLIASLMKEASINAKQAGERGISAKSVKKVTKVSFLDSIFHCVSHVRVLIYVS